MLNTVVRGIGVPNYPNVQENISVMIFINNKYTKWYNSIIANAQTRILSKGTYVEKHHIIPKSLGGIEIVALLPREHSLKLIAWNRGIFRTSAEKELMSNNRKKTASIVGAWNKDRPHSSETLAKITEKAKLRTNKICPYCAKSVSPSNYARWHGNNCPITQS